MNFTFINLHTVIKARKKCWYLLPFSEFEPLPLYNHVHVPGGNEPAISSVRADLNTASAGGQGTRPNIR